MMEELKHQLVGYTSDREMLRSYIKDRNLYQDRLERVLFLIPKASLEMKEKRARRLFSRCLEHIKTEKNDNKQDQEPYRVLALFVLLFWITVYLFLRQMFWRTYRFIWTRVEVVLTTLEKQYYQKPKSLVVFFPKQKKQKRFPPQKKKSMPRRKNRFRK